MIRRFTLLALLLAFALPATAAAQTPTLKLQWDQAEAPAVVAPFQYTLKVDTGAAILLAPTCVANGASTRCTAPLGTLATGPHTLALTVFGPGGSTAADPLNTTPPGKPTTVTVTVVITVP